MGGPAERPDASVAYGLYTGSFRSQIARLSLLLDVYGPLADGPSPAAEVARRCRADPTGVALLLDCLVSGGVLDRHDGMYALTPVAAAFLVHGSRAYAGDVVVTFTRPETWSRVEAAIREGDHVPLEDERDFVQDAWLESYSDWRLASAREMWTAAGVPSPGRGDLDVLDLACGCAVKSLVLAQDHAQARVTCLDRPAVLEVAGDLAGRMGVEGRVVLRPGDLLTADLGDAAFDVCLLGQVTHYLTGDQNRDLLRRVRAALRPGGRLVIDVPMADDTPSEGTSIVSLLLWASHGTMAWSFETYREWAADAGFADIRRVGERWLAAEPPG